MQPTDRPEFLRVLNGLAAIKGKDLTAEALSIWWSATSRWAIDDFKAAASHLVGSCQFMPTPYDFEKLRTAGQLTAGEAWASVVGGDALEPGSRIARAAQIVGGQQHIRHADVVKDLPFLRNRFMEVYDDLGDADSVREALPKVVNTKAITQLRQLLR